MAADFADLDQKAFGWIFRAVRGLVRPATPARPGMVALEDLEVRLVVVASAIAERTVRLEASDELGGVAGTTLRLPRTIDTLDSKEANALLYLARTVLDATAVRHGVGAPDELDESTRTLAATLLLPSLARAAALELPAFEALHAELARALLEARPGLAVPASERARAIDSALRCILGAASGEPQPPHEDIDRIAALTPEQALPHAIRLATRLLALPGSAREPAFVPVPLAGRLLPRPTPPRATAGPKEPPSRAAQSSGTERRGRAPDEVKRIVLPKDRQGENPLEHSFEKVHTADRYQGGRKALDGEDELDAHQEALDELDLREVIRTHEAARSVYRLDGGASLEAPELAEESSADGEVYRYDEWDGTRYRKGFCRVVVEVPEARASARIALDPAARIRVRRVFESLEQARRFRPRMPNGSEVDLDAMVERHGFVRAGHEGPTRLYLDRPRIEPDVATTILLDLSSSSDAYLDGRRVMDVAREAVALLADVLDELGTPFAIAGFHSHTHQDCRYLSIKSFTERWPGCAPRLAAVEPRGYTRMGPAIRHACAGLAKSPARRRALLLVTDGRPSDYDRYEGRYGVIDVKKACDEASMHGLGVFALAIAARRSAHLSAMFGPGGYEVLPHPKDLAERLSRAEALHRR